MMNYRIAQILLPLMLLASFGVCVSASAAAPVRNIAAHDLVSIASSIPKAGKLDVRVPALDGEDRESIFELERFEVFGSGSKVVVLGEHGEQTLEPPANVYFRGHLSNDPHSLVLLTVDVDGQIRGLVSKAGDIWMMEAAKSSPDQAAPLVTRKVDLEGELGEVSRNWTCDADRLGIEHSPLDELVDVPSKSSQSVAGGSGSSYVARIAIETDREFYN